MVGGRWSGLTAVAASVYPFFHFFAARFDRNNANAEGATALAAFVLAAVFASELLRRERVARERAEEAAAVTQNRIMPRRVVDVLVPVALDKPYSYRVPEALAVKPGDVVSVPLGAREATAVVWAENPKPNPRLDNRLKDIEDKIDVPPLRPELRSFVDWVANYTLSSRGMVLRMCLRMGEHLGAERERAACGLRACRRRA